MNQPLPSDHANIDTLFVVIPAYDPGEILLDVVAGVRAFSSRIVVVNDGSRPDQGPVFSRLGDYPEVTLLTHATNQGKGAALITGITHCLGIMPDDGHIITIDSDGQHDPEDIKQFTDYLAGHGDVDFAIGERRDDARMPVKSRLGNLLSRFFFRLNFGEGVHDTQTGFRMLSKKFAQLFVQAIKPGKYETELDMLILAQRRLGKIHTVPVRTVYYGNNETSKFKPISDSARIIKLFLVYSTVTVASFVVDYLFYLMLVFGMDVDYIQANVAARILSASFNFLGHKYFSFGVRRDMVGQAFRYALAVFNALLLSSILLFLIVEMFGIGRVIAKPVADSLVFVINFIVLNKLVFHR